MLTRLSPIHIGGHADFMTFQRTHIWTVFLPQSFPPQVLPPRGHPLPHHPLLPFLKCCSGLICPVCEKTASENQSLRELSIRAATKESFIQDQAQIPSPLKHTTAFPGFQVMASPEDRKEQNLQLVPQAL